MQKPWGIIFGGGIPSTALILKCKEKGLTPDWIVYADTGSEHPEILSNVYQVKEWCEGWVDVTILSQQESLHDYCIRTNTLPSKVLGYALCMMKWKKNPLDRWLKDKGYFDSGTIAVSYTKDTAHLLTKPCSRGDDPHLNFWYPLLEWDMDLAECELVCKSNGFHTRSSSCFICPNTDWGKLQKEHPDLYGIALELDKISATGKTKLFDPLDVSKQSVLEDRCRHSGCFH